ncbi:hypothetical protein A9Q96_13210 [Rhodobacterales bacterium 52_120_T64]|nr:hypothetical protein A9Q96_13210 [Rhodobacterales bacterium 52_120_T64]
MSFLSSLERTVMPFVTRVQDMIGRVIYDYTGVISSDLVNQAVFYLVSAVMLYLVWLLIKPTESVYHYRPQHHH